MNSKPVRIAYLSAIVWLALAGAVDAQQGATAPPKDDTETVYVVARVKEGKGDEYPKVTEQAWAVALEHRLVVPKSHMLFRGTDEAGKTYFVEILTWKSHAAPDHAPADLRAIWAQMQEVCEARDGHQGIEIAEVHVVPTR